MKNKNIINSNKVILPLITFSTIVAFFTVKFILLKFNNQIATGAESLFDTFGEKIAAPLIAISFIAWVAYILFVLLITKFLEAYGDGHDNATFGMTLFFSYGLSLLLITVLCNLDVRYAEKIMGEKINTGIVKHITTPSIIHTEKKEPNVLESYEPIYILPYLQKEEKKESLTPQPRFNDPTYVSTEKNNWYAGSGYYPNDSTRKKLEVSKKYVW